MPNYIISQIHPADRRASRQMDQLLAQEGIQRDTHLDYSVGLFDEDYQLAATGSCFHNTLRCLAVSSLFQGEGLLNQVISHLTEYQCSLGNMELFLYTKCSTAKFFQDLGFYEIARVHGNVVFMENRKQGFSRYLQTLQEETGSRANGVTTIGAVIMNANPFTLGHKYLLEQAAAQVDLLHVFVVSEDVSLVPFVVRDQLIREGSAHIKNLVYHQTGCYMISSATFPSYFLKDSDTVIHAHAKLDIQIFLQIASALGITCRFVGDEPFSHVTSIYNQVMKDTLEASGIDCRIFPRLEDSDGAISASAVRVLLQKGDFTGLQHKVPPATYNYFTSPESMPVIQRIRQAHEVIHY